MSKQFLIGVDCGTTSVKAVLFDADGNEITTVSRDNEVIINNNCTEQDMEKLWESVRDCLRELTERNKACLKGLAGIGISGQGEGLWALDSQGKPVRNAILWNDSRAAGLVEQLKQREDYKEIRNILGTYYKTGSTLILMKWFYEYEPEKYEKTACFFSCKDYIRYRLTGKLFWELSDASASCVDLKSRSYAMEVFKSLGLKGIEEKLLPLISATDCGGRITQLVHEGTGLPEGLPVSGGMLDVLSASAGLGGVRPGDTCVILGTTGMTSSVVSSYQPDEGLSGWGIHLDGACYGRGTGCMAATPNLDWAIRNFFRGEKPEAVFARMEEELKGREPGDSGVMYHPHISSAGERAPFFAPDATASFFGIRQNTGSMELLHAVLEGVALAVRDCLESTGLPKMIYLSGGGAKSGVWAQIVSDVLGAEAAAVNSSEPAARGAALTAALMTDILKDEEEIRKKFLVVRSRYVPDMGKHEKYNELYRMYKHMQRAVKPFWEWRKQYLK